MFSWESFMLNIARPSADLGMEPTDPVPLTPALVTQAEQTLTVKVKF